MSVGADLKLPFWFAFFPAVYTIYLDFYCESSSIHNYSIYQVFVMCRKLKLSVARSTVLVTLYNYGIRIRIWFIRGPK